MNGRQSDLHKPGSKRPSLSIEEELPSDLALLDDAVSGIVLMIKCAGWQEDIDQIDLAVREALTNAIIHGNRCDPGKAVRVRVELRNGRGLLISIKDTGQGFDPNRVPDPRLGAGRMSNHGRGLFLIKTIMDDVRFEFDPGTSIHMRRYPHHKSGNPEPLPTAA